MRQCNIITLPQPSHANILLACHIFLIIECLSICKSQSLHFYDITLSHKQIRSTQTPHLFQLNMTKHVHIDKINCEQVPFSSKTVGKMQTIKRDCDSDSAAASSAGIGRRAKSESLFLLVSRHPRY